MRKVVRRLKDIKSKEDFFEFYANCQADWNLFAREVLGVKLDRDQQAILEAIQTHRRVSVRSGTARGKDYVAAVASMCFLYLFSPSKVINTAPTGRQVSAIMLPEITRLYQNARIALGGRLMADGIRFESDKTWFLMGFKAGDKNIEAWSGFHSPNLMVVVTEASGLDQTTFDTIEGILQGNSRLVLVFNPNNTKGEAYNSARSPLYKSFKLNCLKSPNVLAKKVIIPGQVDYDWVVDKLNKPGWVTEIPEDQFNEGEDDFEFEGKYYRPSNLFRVKVLGEFPKESDDTLFPLSWIERSNEMWREAEAEKFKLHNNLLLGCDIAGMGRDRTVMVHRYDRYVMPLTVYQSDRSTVHMEVAGKIKLLIAGGEGYAFIDTIGEGAGVHSRLREQGIDNAVSCKGSENASGLKDVTGQRTFANMRAFMYWSLRDALDPKNGINLLLPPDDELTEELTETKYQIRSDGSIIIEPKENIKKRLGRSPDKADALAYTFYPLERVVAAEDFADVGSKEDLGFF